MNEKTKSITDSGTQMKSSRSRAVGYTLYFVHDKEFNTKSMNNNWLLVFGGNNYADNNNITYEMFDIDNIGNGGIEKNCG